MRANLAGKDGTFCSETSLLILITAGIFSIVLFFGGKRLSEEKYAANLLFCGLGISANACEASAPVIEPETIIENYTSATVGVSQYYPFLTGRILLKSERNTQILVETVKSGRHLPHKEGLTVIIVGGSGKKVLLAYRNRSVYRFLTIIQQQCE